MCVCVCVCACVRARTRARVHACGVCARVYLSVCMHAYRRLLFEVLTARLFPRKVVVFGSAARVSALFLLLSPSVSFSHPLIFHSALSTCCASPSLSSHMPVFLFLSSSQLVFPGIPYHIFCLISSSFPQLLHSHRETLVLLLTVPLESLNSPKKYFLSCSCLPARQTLRKLLTMRSCS